MSLESYLKYKASWPEPEPLEAAEKRLTDAKWTKTDYLIYLNPHKQVRLSLHNYESDRTFVIETPTQNERWPAYTLPSAIESFERRWRWEKPLRRKKRQ
jgi:hypothetical protein